jgi:Voltage gated chloride channel
MPVQPAREIVRTASQTLLSAHHWKARIVLWSAGAAVGRPRCPTAAAQGRGRSDVVSGAALLSGGSIGREGPTVHVGAAVARYFGRWMPHTTQLSQRRALTLAGGAAGVAAAFNTPLAGIVFAIEELSRSFEERASGAALTVASLCSAWLASEPASPMLDGAAPWCLLRCADSSWLRLATIRVALPTAPATRKRDRCSRDRFTCRGTTHRPGRSQPWPLI